MMSITSGLTTLLLERSIPQNAAQAGVSVQSATTPAASFGSVSATTGWQQNAQQAVATLKQGASQGSGGGAKAAAMQRLVQLKAQLKNLMMFPGDPKSRAQAAARMAKEIGEAAQEYAQAGGSSSGASSAAPASPSPPAADSPAGPAGAGGATDAMMADDPPATTDAASLAPTSLQPDVVPLILAVTADVAQAPVARVGSAAGAGSQAASSSSSSADQAFIRDARLLARQANGILQNAIQEAHRKKETTSESGAEGSKALAVIDAAASALESGGGTGGDTSIGYGASAQAVMAAPVPAVVVTA